MQENLLKKVNIHFLQNLSMSGHRRDMPKHSKGHKPTANIILSDEKLEALSKIRDKTWMPALTTLMQRSIGSPTTVITRKGFTCSNFCLGPRLGFQTWCPSKYKTSS